MPLTDKQIRFCEEYLIDLNATYAAIRAGINYIKNPKGFYIYLLVDPTDNSIFYIGKGKGKRAEQHFKDFKRRHIDNSAKAEVIRQIVKFGHKPEVYYLQDQLTEEDAFSIERFMIRALKNFLTNISNGIASNSEKEKIRAKAMLDRIMPYEKWMALWSPDIKSRITYFKIKRELRLLAGI
jgi:hypothetical protein